MQRFFQRLLVCCFLSFFFFSGTSLAGPAVTLRWQEEVHLNDVLLTSLLPVVDGATGKIGTKDMSDFFNTKMLHPTSKVRGANNLVLEKVSVYDYFVASA